MVNENKRMYIPEENHQGKPEIYLRGPSNRSLPCPLSLISRLSSAAATGRGQPLTPGSIRSTQLPSAGRAPGRPPQPLTERLLLRRARAKKSCFKSPSSPSQAKGRGGAAGEGAARWGRGLGGAAELPLLRVKRGLTRRAAAIRGSFPINALPVLLTSIWVRLPKAPGEEPFPSLTLFPISHTKGEGKGELSVYTYVHHTCAHAESACIKMKVGFYLGK